MLPPSQAVPDFVGLAAHPVRWRLLGELADSDYRVRELVTRVGVPQNLISYHLRLLRDGELVTATRSSFDGRDSYYHLDLDRCAESLAGAGAALHPALRMHPAPPVSDLAARATVLFVCTGNSARSAIAEALLLHHTAGRVEAVSAGSRPKPIMHPNTVRVLHDDFGIDISTQQPRHLDTLAGRRFDHVITLCDKAKEACPEFEHDPRCVHWSIPDPATAADTDEGSYPAFQRTATEINTRVRHLLPVLATAHHREV
ncbi:ArsR family transcriptional regulator [Mycolicibacterium aromaticivorans JS19b1 = JCM 16368]|uniref:ArsR family transcriptional regulator n=1 Tax=Mycolicibacterium aromaticivorans JS19b1 = JCM 16368 TaxID=1440774 RepID=A0A064CGI8_9MYCO|nr:MULTISPECIES: ArsR family transcriptional regulator [Mycolicibacterium]KDE99460.1 ArsR family transcriptional regulator [Mycolicibacterium aromaticivorans JS19b1 = JCM 16368]MCV7153996.1 ArsR family transcriptional regulator [Mycolicibacterium pyrenivorans]